MDRKVEAIPRPMHVYTIVVECRLEAVYYTGVGPYFLLFLVPYFLGNMPSLYFIAISSEIMKLLLKPRS
jgi:hypothetical protein